MHKPISPDLSCKAILFILTLIFSLSLSNGQSITHSMLSKIQDRFKTYGNYTPLTILESVNTRTDGLPPDVETVCLSGKEMLVVAVFGAKPQKLFARMLVTKHFGKKIAYDEHPFQNAAFEETLNIFYSLVQVQFPAEANTLNCRVNLQVYDKADPAAKVWLLIFSK